MEEKVVCPKSQCVDYTYRHDNSLSLNVPLEQATNLVRGGRGREEEKRGRKEGVVGRRGEEGKKGDEIIIFFRVKQGRRDTGP